MKKVLLLALLLPPFAQAQTPTVKQCIDVTKDLLVLRDFIETCKPVLSTPQILQLVNGIQTAEGTLSEYAGQCRPVLAQLPEEEVKRKLNWNRLVADIRTHETMNTEQRTLFCNTQSDKARNILQQYSRTQ